MFLLSIMGNSFSMFFMCRWVAKAIGPSHFLYIFQAWFGAGCPGSRAWCQGHGKRENSTKCWVSGQPCRSWDRWCIAVSFCILLWYLTDQLMRIDEWLEENAFSNILQAAEMTFMDGRCIPTGVLKPTLFPRFSIKQITGRRFYQNICSTCLEASSQRGSCELDTLSTKILRDDKAERRPGIRPRIVHQKDRGRKHLDLGSQQPKMASICFVLFVLVCSRLFQCDLRCPPLRMTVEVGSWRSGKI